MKYSIIYADPPWPMKKIPHAIRPNQRKMDYQTMKVTDIAGLPVSGVADENAVLFLWTTHRFLPEALDVMKAWGFRYQRTITWDKGNGMCLYGFHHRTELLLFGYCGKLERYPRRPAFPTLITSKSPRHSQKPSIIRELIAPFGERKLELFAREKTPGWHAWGNEIKSDMEFPLKEPTQ